MNLTTKQAADKLKLSTSGVNGLRKRGLLTDVAPNNGKTRHMMFFDSKQVNELAKTWRKRSHLHSNGQLQHPTVTVNVPVAKPVGFFSVLERIVTDLDTLHDKVNNLSEQVELLVKIWS